MKLKGPIEKEDPNTVRKKVSPKSMEKIEKRVCEESIKGENGSNLDTMSLHSYWCLVYEGLHRIQKLCALEHADFQIY